MCLQNYDLGHTTVLEHTINTGTHPPVHQKLYPVPFAQRKVIQDHIDKMLKQGVIRPSNSPWSSPVVLVKKPDNTLRFCCDFRGLNAVTIKDTYPLPRTDDILATLGKTRFYSSLDLMAGYWQVGVAEQDRPKTAFITFGGLWEWNTLPFGLCNAPSLFQRLMERILAGILWNFCFCYIDDILVCSPTFEQHLDHLKQVFQRLRDANLKLKLKKCQFARTEVPYLGHVVTKDGVKVNPAKTQKIHDYPQPTSVTELKGFIGLASYYRRYVPNFSTIAAPLNALLRKATPYKWSKHCEEAFTQLKSCLSKPPVLIYPDYTQTFLLQCDASG